MITKKAERPETRHKICYQKVRNEKTPHLRGLKVEGYDAQQHLKRIKTGVC